MKRSVKYRAKVLASALLWGASTIVHAQALPGTPSLAPMVERVTPGVVGISVSQSASAQNPLLRDPAFQPFLEELERRRSDREAGDSPGSRPEDSAPRVRPAGSGVIVDARQGLVLTNHHVIQGAARVVVVLKDRREFEARVVGSDAGTDVALLRIPADKLAEIKMGDSPSLRIGDYVVAIGNPFGLGQTVTMGIVSALGRGLTPDGYEDYIQTDAPINPGNSGGALVSLQGDLMGINTAIYTGSESGRGNIGIGFAVPADMAREVMAQLLQFGEVRRGRLGVQLGEVTPALARTHRLPEIAGALVTEVSPRSPAALAGMRAQDVVVAFNGRTVHTAGELRTRMALVPVGSTAELTVMRFGEPHSIRPRVEAIVAGDAAHRRTPNQPDTAPEPDPGKAPADKVMAGVHLQARPDGLLVTQVQAGSTGHGVGFRQGDLIVAVDRQPVQTATQLAQMLHSSGTKVVIVVRGDTKLRLRLG